MSENITRSLRQSIGAVSEELHTCEIELQKQMARLHSLHAKCAQLSELKNNLMNQLSEFETETNRLEKLKAGTPTQPVVLPGMDPAHSSKPTLKEQVFNILGMFPDGLDVQSLITMINRMFDNDVQRTTLSPLLSRMKHDDLLDLVEDRWKLSPQNRQRKIKDRVVITHRPS